MKDKYGENVLSEASGVSDSDSDSGEDSDPEEQAALLSGEIFDDEFLRVYKALKRNDPIIYDTSVKFMSDDAAPAASSSRSNRDEMPAEMSLMDYHVKLMKEKQGVTEEDDPEAHSKNGYFEELSDIKNELKAALSDDEDEELFRPIVKKETKKNSDVPQRQSLDLGEPENDADQFLQQFIMNKPFLRETSFGSKTTEPSAYCGFDQESEKEDSIHQSIATEAKHRFEEAGSSEIRRYPRTLTAARDLVVREEKSAKRKEAKARKKSEKSEDLKRFTDLRRQELSAKLSKLQQTSGNRRFMDPAADGFAFQSLVDDDQFDPDKHDEKMRTLFDSDYYELDADGQKPEFDFIEGIDDDIDPDEEREDCGQEVIKDAERDDVDEEEEEEEEGSESGSRKLSRKIKKQRKRRVKKVDLDQLPDYDDVVGGLPVRFKYCRVTPNDFGLSAEEILFSDEKELNAWVSLKKAVSFRAEQEEQGDLLRYNAKRGDFKHKKKILKSLFTEAFDQAVEKKAKKRRRRGRDKPHDGEPAVQSELPAEESLEVQNDTVETNGEQDDSLSVRERGGRKRKEKRKEKRSRRKRVPQKGVDEERLRAYGFSKTDMKRKKLL